MLVLTRKQQESVIVGAEDGIHRLLKVTVLQIAGGRVKLGFEVDGDIPVNRLEVWERLRADAEEASRREGSRPFHIRPG